MLEPLLRASLGGGIAVVLVWLLCRALPSLSPGTRTWVWWCAAARFVVSLAWTSPVTLPILPADVAPIAVDRLSSAATSFEAVTTAKVPTDVAFVRSSDEEARAIQRLARAWPFALNGLWLLGVLVAAESARRDWQRAARLLAQSSQASPQIVSITERLAGLLSLGRVPDVRISHDVDTPVVVGMRHPVVLLPTAGIARWSPSQQQMSICHELAHIKRADLRLGCVPALAEMLFFFHPLMRLAAREYLLSREAACDAAVLDLVDAAPGEYGRLLLDLGVTGRRRTLSAAGASWSSSTLKRRLVMLNDSTAASSMSRALAVIVVAATAAMVVPVKLVARPATPQTPSAAKPVSPPSPQPTQTYQLRVVGPADALAASDDLVIFQSSGTASGKNRQVTIAQFDARGKGASALTAAIERARQFRQNGEAMVWFKRDDHEYVLRDADTLREIAALTPDTRTYVVSKTRGAPPDVVKRVYSAPRPEDDSALSAQMQNLQTRLADLTAQMRASARPADLDRRMVEVGRQLESLGRTMQGVTPRVSASARDRFAEFRAIVDRAFAKGLATQVK